MNKDRDNTTNLSLKHRTFSGLKWSGLQQGVTQISTFIFGVTLMKFLAPEDYGIIAMVTVFSGFLAIFQDFGLTTSLIQKKEINDDDKQVVFWAMFSISIFLGTLFFFSAPFLASFYNENKVLWVARAFSFNFFVGALGTVDIALYRRDLNFKVIALTRISAVIISGVVAIICAYLGFEYWSIVIQTILSNAILSLAMFITGRFRPTLKFSWASLKYHFNFGFPLFGSRALVFGSKNLDKVVIGKILTKVDLGYYTRAYNLLFLPVHQMSLVFSTVMFSSFAKMQDRKKDIANIYSITTSSLIFLLAPFSVLFYFNAETIIITVFGWKWYEIIDLMQILVFLILLHPLSVLRSNINLSQGHTKKDFKFNVFSSVVDIGAVLVGVSFGLKWIAFNLVIASFLKALVALNFVSTSLDKSFLSMLKGVLPGIINATLLFPLGYGMNTLLIQSQASAYARFTIETIVFIAVTILALYLLDKRSFKLAHEVIRNFFKRTLKE